jgi:hypothetical protein
MIRQMNETGGGDDDDDSSNSISQYDINIQKQRLHIVMIKHRSMEKQHSK